MIAELEWDELNNLSIFDDGYTYVASYRDDLHVIFNPRKVGEYGLSYIGNEELTYYYLAYELKRCYFLYLVIFPLWKYKYYATVKEMIPVLKRLMFNCEEINIKLPDEIRDTLRIPPFFYNDGYYY